MGGGWARREGDADDAAVGPGSHRQPRLIIDEAARGSAPHPARALPEFGPPRHSLRERGREEREADMCESVRWWREGVRRRSRGRSGPRHGGGASSRLAPRVTRGGARGAIGSPRVRRVARRKVRKEGRTAEAWVRRAPRATPWSLAPRFGAADVSSRRLKRLRAAPASQPGRARPPPKPGDAPFRVRSDRRRTLDTALRGAGQTPHPAPTSRTPPEAPLWVG